MATTKDYQHTAGKNQNRLIQILNDSIQELLYAHIDQLFRQWLKTILNAMILLAALASKIFGRNTVHVPDQVLNISLSPGQKEQLGRGEETELIQGFISKKGNTFSAFLKIDDTGELKFRFPDKNDKIIPAEYFGVVLTAEQREQLKNGQETGLISDLKGKRGISFSAFLAIQENGKIKLRFPDRNEIASGKAPGTLLPGMPLTSPAQQTPVGPLSPNPPQLQSKMPSPGRPSSPGKPPSKTQGQSLDNKDPTSPEKTPALNKLISQHELHGFIVYGRVISSLEALSLVETGKTTMLDGFQTAAGKQFSARLNWQDQQLSIHIPQRTVSTGITIIPKKIFSAEISEQNRRLLLNGRATCLIEGMVSPSGIRFDGWLKFDELHRLNVISTERVREIPARTTIRNADKGMGP